MIKAIIFDFYSVLAIRDTGSFRKTNFPDDKLKMQKALDMADKLGLGQIGYDEYIDGLAELGNVDREEVLKHTEDYTPNRELLDYIQNNLKPKYRIGIISNAGSDWVAKILGEDIKLFDDIVLSYQVGRIKPDPAIYEHSAQNLGVSPAEAVFIDDIKTYCDGAEKVGMKSVWYRDFNQTKKDLEQILSTNADN